MLSHCANPQCARPFLRLGEGRLFQVETGSVAIAGNTRAPVPAQHRQPPRGVERFWLCDQCARVWTLVHDRNQGVALLPLSMPPASAQFPSKQHEHSRQMA
jgi:hypothetical protein